MANKTRPRRRGGASQGRDAGPGTVPDPQAPDRSRCAIGQDTTGRQETAWPGGSNLVRHPKGSNGGVHRGADKTLRINAVRGLFLQALAGEQLRRIVVDGQKRRHGSMVPMAMCDDIVAGLRLVARRGAEGKNLKEFLVMVFAIHKAMQPGQYEKNGNGHQPMPATFVVERPAPPPEEPGQAPAKPPAPGTLLDANGQEYVA